MFRYLYGVVLICHKKLIRIILKFPQQLSLIGMKDVERFSIEWNEFENSFNTFLKNLKLGKYAPRDYIVENLSAKPCAEIININ